MTHAGAVAIVVIVGVLIGIGNFIYGNPVIGAFDLLVAALVFGSSRSGGET